MARQEVGQLFDEQRVTATPPGDVTRPAAGDRLSGDLADELLDLGVVEPRETQVFRRAGQLGQPPRLGTARLEFVVAVGPDDNEGNGSRPAGDELEQLQRRRVSPLQIVQDDNDRC